MAITISIYYFPVVFTTSSFKIAITLAPVQHTPFTLAHVHLVIPIFTPLSAHSLRRVDCCRYLTIHDLTRLCRR